MPLIALGLSCSVCRRLQPLYLGLNHLRSVAEGKGEQGGRVTGWGGPGGRCPGQHGEPGHSPSPERHPHRSVHRPSFLHFRLTCSYPHCDSLGSRLSLENTASLQLSHDPLGSHLSSDWPLLSYGHGPGWNGMGGFGKQGKRDSSSFPLLIIALGSNWATLPPDEGPSEVRLPGCH